MKSKAIRNSFRSSNRKYCIRTAADLKKVMRHNSRGFYDNQHYDVARIVNLIGDASCIFYDVETYINKKFQPTLDKYNLGQPRIERKITITAFNFFSNNKRTDICTEQILQLGDAEFWNCHRIDTPVEKGGRKFLLHSFPDTIRDTMAKIFLQQLIAFRNIYKTHGDIILGRIKAAKEAAERFIASLSVALRVLFERLYSTKSDEQKKELETLSKDIQDSFLTYRPHRKNLDTIVDGRLIDRIENNQMEIELISAVLHLDEYSPHVHAISVCSTSGYQYGLEERPAKSIVLNKWALTILQDRMREIAKEEMKKHPEIFADTELAEKRTGYNKDPEKSKYIWMEQEKIIKEIAQKKDLLASLNNSIAQAMAINDAWQEKLEEIKDDESYVAEAEHVEMLFANLNVTLDQLVNRKGPMRNKSLEQALCTNFGLFYNALQDSLQKLRLYEIRETISEEYCVSEVFAEAKRTLDNQINSYETMKDMSEKKENKKKINIRENSR